MTVFSASLPQMAAGRWCRVELSFAAPGAFWAKLEMSDQARDQVVREAFFPGRGRRRSLLLHVPYAAGRLTLSIFTPLTAADNTPLVALQVLGRAAAGLRLLARFWRTLPKALRGSPLGLPGRVRALLGQSAARRGEAPPYPVWIDLYDRWGDQERHAFAAVPSAAQIAVVVVADDDEAALARTLDSIADQWHAPAGTCVLRAFTEAELPKSAWLAILSAGECLAPHALSCLALAVQDAIAVRAVCADLDRIDARGQRHAPAFRPPPDPWLMRSSLFAEGVWMFARESFDKIRAGLPPDANQARLALARHLPVAALKRVPLILTHCPGAGSPTRKSSITPLLTESSPSVSILVPSACRSRHVLGCLQKLAHGTDYPSVEILVVVSSVVSADRNQVAIMRRVGALPRVRVITLDTPVFNFAAVVNQAAKQARGSLLLLQNDDVVPIWPGWLRGMVAHTLGAGEARADIVGARLLYGNRLVQHAGVILGLANLCEHGFRLAAPDDPGPQGLAHLDRQVSAVTAACLLVRRTLFESLGGLDEAFAIALNDVDFCLRAGETGARVVFEAGVDMYHFESLSLGRHYQGARAGHEAREVRRLRDRWAIPIGADPFYHPCASLEMGREFQPGFPPRQTPLSWISQEASARD